MRCLEWIPSKADRPGGVSHGFRSATEFSASLNGSSSGNVQCFVGTGGASPRGFCGQKATRTTSLATWSLEEAEAAAEFAAAASRDWIGYKGHSMMARDAGSANVIRRAAPKSKFSTGR
jgi:hypothetical protein